MSKNSAVLREQKTFVSSYQCEWRYFPLLSPRIGACLAVHISLSFSHVGNDHFRLRQHWTKVQYTEQRLFDS